MRVHHNQRQRWLQPKQLAQQALEGCWFAISVDSKLEQHHLRRGRTRRQLALHAVLEEGRAGGRQSTVVMHVRLHAVRERERCA
jgi:hypothetical protein